MLEAAQSEDAARNAMDMHSGLDSRFRDGSPRQSVVGAI